MRHVPLTSVLSSKVIWRRSFVRSFLLLEHQPASPFEDPQRRWRHRPHYQPTSQARKEEGRQLVRRRRKRKEIEESEDIVLTASRLTTSPAATIANHAVGSSSSTNVPVSAHITQPFPLGVEDPEGGREEEAEVERTKTGEWVPGRTRKKERMEMTGRRGWEGKKAS